MLASEACVQVWGTGLSSWRVLPATAQALSLFPAHRGPGPWDCWRVNQVGKPAETQVCTPVSARPGNQDRSEATWLSGGPAGQHGSGVGRGASVLGSPHSWSLGFGSWPPEFCLGVRGGEAGVRAGPWGCWGPPGKPSVLTPQGAGPWPHAAVGRLMAREAAPWQKAACCQRAAPSPSGPSSLSRLWSVLSLKCSFPGPNPALWTQAPGAGGELTERCCEPHSCGFQFPPRATGVSVRTPLQGRPRVRVVASLSESCTRCLGGAPWMQCPTWDHVTRWGQRLLLQRLESQGPWLVPHRGVGGQAGLDHCPVTPRPVRLWLCSE